MTREAFPQMTVRAIASPTTKAHALANKPHRKASDMTSAASHEKASEGRAGRATYGLRFWWVEGSPLISARCHIGLHSEWGSASGGACSDRASASPHELGLGRLRNITTAFALIGFPSSFVSREATSSRLSLCRSIHSPSVSEPACLAAATCGPGTRFPFPPTLDLGCPTAHSLCLLRRRDRNRILAHRVTPRVEPEPRLVGLSHADLLAKHLSLYSLSYLLRRIARLEHRARDPACLGELPSAGRTRRSRSPLCCRPAVLHGLRAGAPPA
jgi:hypothetical protein